MSLGTIIGFIAGLVMVVGSIFMAAEHPGAFIDFPSIIIVFGGTFATLFISFEAPTAFKALRLMFQAFSQHKDSTISLKEEVGRIVRWSYVIQKGGLQGLENEIDGDLRKEDSFLSYGADLVITGYTGSEIHQILTHVLESKIEKEGRVIEALKKMGGDAPAYGMLGTLIGLIVMLGSMSKDPGAIGPSMAVALVTTFYGVILARLFFIPLATKMATRYDITLFKRNLQMEGLVLLAERKSPRYIQDKINSFVEIEEQFSIDTDMNREQRNS